MPITKLLENNAEKFSDRTALVEINPEVTEMRRVTWKEYELIEQSSAETYRREITWSVFNEKANRCANLLMSRGIKEEDARAMIVSGFADPVSKELPLEYAVEMNNLIKLEMSGNM